jgi:hypothetical protein
MVSKIEMNNGAGKRDRRFLLLPNWQRTAMSKRSY